MQETPGIRHHLLRLQLQDAGSKGWICQKSIYKELRRLYRRAREGLLAWAIIVKAQRCLGFHHLWQEFHLTKKKILADRLKDLEQGHLRFL